MRRRRFLTGVGAAVATGARIGSAAPAEARRQPNFLVIIGDDVTHTDLGLYGGTNVKTPNIDGFAKQGVKFANAFVAMSMCAPCRQELYSGLYPMRSGATYNHSRSKPGTKSVCHYLDALGYRVGLAGKRHINPRETYPFTIVPGFEPSCTRVTARADQAGIREFMSSDDQPFCLFVALVTAHTPWTVGDPGQFDQAALKLPPSFPDLPKVRENYAEYLAEIAELDRQVGEILATLEATGKAENTLAIFTSEQGGQWPGAKWTAWEQGMHTAFACRWPGVIEPGRKTDAIVQYADVTPTLVDAAGGDVAALGLDGSSFLGVLQDKTDRHRQYAYGMHNNVPEGPPYPIRTIRDEHYRYIVNLSPENEYVEKHMEQPKRWADYWVPWKEAANTEGHAKKMLARFRRRPAEELYRHPEDPYELTNLVYDPRHAQTRARLKAELERWMKDQDDPGAALDTQEMFDANRNMGKAARKQ